MFAYRATFPLQSWSTWLNVAERFLFSMCCPAVMLMIGDCPVASWFCKDSRRSQISSSIEFISFLICVMIASLLGLPTCCWVRLSNSYFIYATDCGFPRLWSTLTAAWLKGSYTWSFERDRLRLCDWFWFSALPSLLCAGCWFYIVCKYERRLRCWSSLPVSMLRFYYGFAAAGCYAYLSFGLPSSSLPFVASPVSPAKSCANLILSLWFYEVSRFFDLDADFRFVFTFFANFDEVLGSLDAWMCPSAISVAACWAVPVSKFIWFTFINCLVSVLVKWLSLEIRFSIESVWPSVELCWSQFGHSSWMFWVLYVSRSPSRPSGWDDGLRFLQSRGWRSGAGP